MTEPVVTRRSLRPVRNLTSTTWWLDAGKRAARTALAAFLPLAALLVAGEVEPLYAVGVTALALVASLATSLANIPEVTGRVVPVWLAVLTRVVKTAAQTLAAALVGAELFQEVPWGEIGIAAGGASLTTLVLALMTYLPETEATVRVPTAAVEDPSLVQLVTALGSIDPADPAVVALERLGVAPSGGIPD